MELEKKGLARNTCVTAYNAVRSLYKANYVRLEVEGAPLAWPKKIKPRVTREELGMLLKSTQKLMHKAYMLCQAQSGLGVSDLLRVAYSDVKKQLEDGAGYVHLRLLSGKRKELGFFDTFFGKMATKALREHLLERDNLKELGTIFTARQGMLMVSWRDCLIGRDSIGRLAAMTFGSTSLRT